MSKTLLIAIGCALLAGLALTAQGGVNGTLGRRLAHPLHASLVSFLVGTCVLLLACLIATRSLPRPQEVLQSPWWSWTGGILGCIVVTTSLLMAPRVGATTWLGLLVCAQFAAAVMLDHFGLVGFAVHAVSPARAAGVGLMVLGVLIVIRS